MPVRGYYRVRTGKHSGVVLSSGSGSNKGCGRALYWVTIGWVIWLYKWLFVGLWKVGKWLLQTTLILVHRISVWIEKKLSDRGYYWGLKKVKTGVIASLLVLLVGACLITTAFGQAGSQAVASSTDTMQATNTVVKITETPIILSPSPTFTATATESIPMTPTITLPAAAGASCIPASSERVSAKVVGITDGDTITVNIDGQDYKLRYIGVDSPETGSTWASQATDANSWLVNGQTVTLVKDVSETDRYDRLLRYVFVGDTFVNYELVRAGWADSGSWPPDTSCDQVFASAAQTAKANQVGMWVPTATVIPYVAPINTPGTAAADGAVAAASCPSGCTTPPAGCVVKGNISSDDEKIYHVPGGGSYTQTKISPEKGERWFCTEAEAVSNGWRKAKN